MGNEQKAGELLAISGEPAADAHPLPEQALLDDCVHCGFCLPACPTYLLWGQEADSPRGRIVLMKDALRRDGEVSAEMVAHFDRCLGCMACVTACPSGVQYDRLLEATRPQLESKYRRPLGQRLFRSAMFTFFTHPGRLRAAVPLLAAFHAVGGRSLLERTGALDRFPKLRAVASLAPRPSLRAVASRLPHFTPAQGPRRARVGLVQGCVQRVFFHDVNRATVDVLAREGCDVFAPPAPRCCGALMLHAGDERGALDLAKQSMEAFRHCDVVITNAAGCGSALRDYGDLMASDPAWEQRAHEFSAKVRDVMEYLAELGPRAERKPVKMRVAYHDPCHLAHAQKVVRAPRDLLSGIPGLELVEPKGSDICCGSAGFYNLVEVEAAEALGRQKAENLIATGAQAIVAGNPGCILQIAAHLEAMGRPIPILHPVELLRRSLTGRQHA